MSPLRQKLGDLALAGPSNTTPMSPVLGHTLDILFQSGKGENPEAQEKFRNFLKDFLPTQELQNSFAKYIGLTLASGVKGKGVESLTKALAGSLAPSSESSEGVSLHTLLEGLSRTLLNKATNYGVESFKKDLSKSLTKELILKPFAEFGYAMETNPYIRLDKKRIGESTVGMIMRSSAHVLTDPMEKEAKRLIRADELVKYLAVLIALGKQIVKFSSQYKNQDDPDNHTDANDNSSSKLSGLAVALAMNISLKFCHYLWSKYADVYTKNETEKPNFSKEIRDNPGSFSGISGFAKNFWLSRWENEELSHKDDELHTIFYDAHESLESVAAFHPDYTKVNEAVQGITGLFERDHAISDRLKAPIHTSMTQYLALLQEYKSYRDNPSFKITNDPNAAGIEFKDVCIVVDVTTPSKEIDSKSGKFKTSLDDIIQKAVRGREKHSFVFPKGASVLCAGTNNLGKSMLRRFMTGGYVIGKGGMVLPTKEEDGDKFANVRVFTHEPFFGPGLPLRENILINSGSTPENRPEDTKALEFFHQKMDLHFGNEGLGKALNEEDGHLKLSLGTQQLASIASAYVTVARAARQNEHVVLILDEACNGLNIGPSGALQDLFEPLKPHMTSFQIAHSNENLIIRPDKLFELAKFTLVEQETNPLTPNELSAREKAIANEMEKRGLSDLARIPVEITTPREERAKLLGEHRGLTAPRRSERIKNLSVIH